MYGWVHNCLKESLLALCGESKWREICEKAGLDVSAAVQKDTYVDDERYFALVDAALEMLPHMTSQDLYDLYGDHFILYLENNGYDTYLHTFGDTLFDLLNNVNRLHSHLACSMDKMKVPSISCQECAGKDSKDCFTLRYSSPRGARLKGMLVGLVKSLARQYFQSTVELTELTNEIDQTTSNPMTIWEVKHAQMYYMSDLIARLILCYIGSAGLQHFKVIVSL
jgi:guanylate cyclase soluble subunit beta